ncbi:MAG TPA: transposase [Ignavibacteria bacterium]|nr:transposase [Bacteroidota bacterium]HRF67254.1 transposase [Ignavibacteria bacterium]
MTLFRKKYRIESSRLSGWDYSNSGIYFITICTFGMKCFFGKIVKGEVILSEAGKIVNSEWLQTAIVRDNVILDEYQVMPNHFHGIIALEKKVLSKFETTHRVVSTKASGTKATGTKASGTLKANSIGSIIGQFKSICTKEIQATNKDFRWQERFHDRIIRNEAELENIRRYIFYNPLKWEEDEFYV